LSRDVKLRLEDALIAAEDAVAWLGSLDAAALRTNRFARAAVERAAFVVGEALASCPPEFRDAHPEVPWREAIGFRNLLAHGYFGVDPTGLHDTIRVDLPPLIATRKQLLGR